MVAGGPGIGKTALWSEGLEEARRRGLRTTATRPSEAEAALPFAALIDLLSDLADEVLPALPAPAGAGARLGPAPRRAGPLARPCTSWSPSPSFGPWRRPRARAPVILGIDDLQWLDEPSARALGFALRRLGGSPVWLVATRRHDGGAAPARLEDALGPDLVHRIELGPMDLGALGLMLRQRLGLALPRARLRAVLERSGGNPLHALELGRLVLRARAWRQARRLGSPETLGGAGRRAGARSGRADAAGAARGRGAVAAVGGAARRAGDVLETAVAAGLVERSGDAVRFSPPALRVGDLHRGDARASGERSTGISPAGSLTRPSAPCTWRWRPTDPTTAWRPASRRSRGRCRSEERPTRRRSWLGRRAGSRPDGDGAAAARRGLAAADYLFAAGDGPAAQAMLDELVAALPAGPSRAEALWRLADVARLPAISGPASASSRRRAPRPARSRGCAARIELARAILVGVRGRRRRLPAPRRGGGRVGAGGAATPSCSPTRSPSSGSHGSCRARRRRGDDAAGAPRWRRPGGPTSARRRGPGSACVLTWAGRLDEARPLLRGRPRAGLRQRRRRGRGHR